MKKYLIALCVLALGVTFSLPSFALQDLHGRRGQAKPGGDIMLNNHQQVLQEGAKYIPGDIHGLASEHVILRCYENGNITQDFNSNTVGCHNYYSASTKSYWRILYGHGVKTFNLEKQENSDVYIPIFWIGFDEKDVHRLTAVSLKAQAFADSHGNTMLAKNAVPKTPPVVAAKQASCTGDFFQRQRFVCESAKAAAAAKDAGNDNTALGAIKTR